MICSSPKVPSRSPGVREEQKLDGEIGLCSGAVQAEDHKRAKGHGHMGTCCGMDYGSWSCFLLVGVNQQIEGCQGSHTGHREAGEMDTPEPRSKVRMAALKDMALLEHLEK